MNNKLTRVPLDGDSGDIANTDWRLNMQIAMEKFWVRHRVTVIAASCLFAWTMTTCGITGAIVRHNTTEEVTQEVQSEMRANFQQYLDQQEQDRRAAQFLSGEESREAAINELADWMDELIATYRMDYGVTEDGARTLAWVFIARLITNSTEFGKSAQEIIERSGAWEGKVIGHAVRNEDTELCREVARDYFEGHYPDGFTSSMTFCNREAAGGVVARNQFITGPNTVYWRFGK